MTLKNRTLVRKLLWHLSGLLKCMQLYGLMSIYENYYMEAIHCELDINCVVSIENCDCFWIDLIGSPAI